MPIRSVAVACIAAIAASEVLAQGPVAQHVPDRAIRRDIPLTNSIRRAYAAGTRDSTGRPGPKYWQLWMDYTIHARLDPPTSTIEGRETIRLRNDSDSSLHAIQLRLDQNIFRGDVPRGNSVPAENHEGFVITKLSVDGTPVDVGAPPGTRLGRVAASNRPSLSGIHTTSARLNLASPIPPRATATLDIEWHNKLAGGAGSGHRMTYRWGDTLFQVAQWYPRVAVYDDLRGWDTDPYLGPAEFYNNFGRFDVSIDVPAGWIVGATGVLQNPRDVLSAAARERLSHVLESDSTRTIVAAGESIAPESTAGERKVWRFVADTVNDFAWATAEHFVWQATRATIPGRGPIPVYVYHLPGRIGQFAQAGPILRHALQFYSKLWMPDPFPQHTMVDGPDNGMEYPMLVMSNDGPADHETGHQWWPMTVSNNETWYGWMDEGFNQYMNILSAADAAHRAPDLDGRGQAYGRTSGDEREGTLMWDENYGGPMYSFQAYGKTPLMLSMLGGIVGDSAVQRAQSDYAKAWRFKHPSPWDYAFFMSNALHRDLGWFWYYWLFTTESVDGAIQSVTSAGGRTIVTVRQDGQMPSPVVLKVRFAPGGPPIRRMPNSVVSGDTAVVTFPVDIWFSGRRTFDATLDFGGRRIEQIVLDPRCRFPDRDASDNVWPRQPAARGENRASTADCTQ